MEARELESVGEWGQAAETYRQLLADEEVATRCVASIRLARCLLETGKRGEADDAEELLHQAQQLLGEVHDDQLQGELLLQRGRLADLEGRLARALDHYTEGRHLLEKAGADLTEAELNLASAERRRGEFNRALARLQTLQDRDLPPRMRAEYDDELGALLIARGETAKATEVLQRALSLDETTANAYASGRSRLLLAEALMRTGARERAKDLIEETIDAYKRADSTSGLSEAYALLGSWYEDGEDFVSAGHYYQESLDLDRTSDDRRGQVRAKRRLARTYRTRGDSRRAAELLRDAKELLPADDDVERAAILQEEAHLALTGSAPNYQTAISLFREALQIARDDGDEWTVALAKRDLARAHREDDDLETAKELLLEAKVALDERGDLRELDDLLDDLGEVLLEMDQYDDAEPYLKQSLELDERLGRIGSKGRSLLLLGKVASRKGDREQAGRCYTEALDLYRKARHEVGQSNAYFHVASWYLERGQLDMAIRHLRDALEIDTRLDRALGKVRTKRQLSEAYRLRGNIDRAEEYLREARRDLGQIDDPVEVALLNLQEGRIFLSNGSYRSAHESLVEARAVLDAHRMPVDAATCGRLMALAAAYEGRYDEALELLETSKTVLAQRGDVPELDELLDDLGTVYLLSGHADLAAAAFNESLEVGERVGWRLGKGRSLLLLASIAQAERDFRTARTHIDDALSEYFDAVDEVGQAAAELALGDWYADDLNPERDLAHAVVAYKNARRIVHQHRDRRGAARCNRKLAHIYIARHEYQRADEALQDAQAELRGIDDVREIAPLELELGRLAASREEPDHSAALVHLYKALDGFNQLGRADDRRTVYQLLIASHQARNETAEALECIRELGAERASIYNVLLRDLHVRVAEASHPSFAAGQYAGAIVDAFAELEHEFRRRLDGTESALPTTARISDVIKDWAASPETSKPPFVKSNGVDRFAAFCLSSFDLLRNPAMHEEVDYTPADAFAALSVAHWIARTLDATEAPQGIGAQRVNP